MVNRKLLIVDTITDMFPHAHCELTYHTPIQLAIAVILSAQATDQAVNKVTPLLFKTYSNLEDLAQANIHDIEKLIQRLGLFRSKAQHLHSFARMLIDKHQGILPSDFDELIELPGIGRKTANVIQAVAFNIPALAVDTHVFRVAMRLGLVKKGSDVYQTEMILKKLIAKDRWIHAHHAMLFFGRYHCTAKKPHCDTCPLSEVCPYLSQQKKAD